MKLSVRKYMSDDPLEYAVFYSKDLRGLGRGPIIDDNITPIVTGLCRRHAMSIKKREESKNNA